MVQVAELSRPSDLVGKDVCCVESQTSSNKKAKAETLWVLEQCYIFYSVNYLTFEK